MSREHKVEYWVILQSHYGDHIDQYPFMDKEPALQEVKDLKENGYPEAVMVERPFGAPTPSLKEIPSAF